jgi:hypothetical protein
VYAAHVCEKQLPGVGYDGQPKHVAVKKNYCAVVGNNKNLMDCGKFDIETVLGRGNLYLCNLIHIKLR